MSTQAVAAERPMHRTDIEGFGRHEDRLEMEHVSTRHPGYSATGVGGTTGYVSQAAPMATSYATQSVPQYATS